MPFLSLRYPRLPRAGLDADEAPFRSSLYDGAGRDALRVDLRAGILVRRSSNIVVVESGVSMDECSSRNATVV